VITQSSSFIASAVESGELDVGVISAPPVLPKQLSLARRFPDEFVAIAPTSFGPVPRRAHTPVELQEVFARRKWLLISNDTTTGKQLRAWMQREGLRAEVAMECDSFDLIVNMVSLGFGVSLVPHRTLALHPQTRPVTRIIVKPKFTRELIVIYRNQPDPPKCITNFVEAVLF
jgi:DNA-binding transcriptional LysR family regulator